MTDMTPEHALQKLLATAEGNPFCPVGHLVEHGLGGADALRAALSRPADTDASRTLDALIALAAGDDGLPDDLRAGVERLRAGVGRKAVPEGWKLVPVEPTDAMISAGADVLDGFRVDALYTYDAMLAAAPEPAEESLTTEQPEDGPVAVCEECGEPVSECGCYPKSVKAERDALRAELIKLEQRDFQELTRANERIAELEAQVRKQGLALEKMAAEFGMKGKDEDAHHPVFAYFAAAEECRKEARRLRGEGE